MTDSHMRYLGGEGRAGAREGDASECAGGVRAVVSVTSRGNVGVRENASAGSQGRPSSSCVERFNLDIWRESTSTVSLSMTFS